MSCVHHVGPLNSSGYGSVRHNGSRMGAHRRAFIRTHGDIPDGMVVMHSCDDRRCVNPDHLSLGTQSENIQDAYNKGRMNLTAKVRGEAHHSAKLTAQDVMCIRQAQLEHAYGMDSKLARQYGVTPKVIRDIRIKKIWTSI